MQQVEDHSRATARTPPQHGRADDPVAASTSRPPRARAGICERPAATSETRSFTRSCTAIAGPGRAHDAVWQAAARRIGCTLRRCSTRHAQPEAVDTGVPRCRDRWSRHRLTASVRQRSICPRCRSRIAWRINAHGNAADRGNARTDLQDCSYDSDDRPDGRPAPSNDRPRTWTAPAGGKLFPHPPRPVDDTPTGGLEHRATKPVRALSPQASGIVYAVDGHLYVTVITSHRGHRVQVHCLTAGHHPESRNHCSCSPTGTRTKEAVSSNTCGQIPHQYCASATEDHHGRYRRPCRRPAPTISNRLSLEQVAKGKLTCFSFRSRGRQLIRTPGR